MGITCILFRLVLPRLGVHNAASARPVSSWSAPLSFKKIQSPMNKKARMLSKEIYVNVRDTNKSFKQRRRRLTGSGKELVLLIQQNQPLIHIQSDLMNRPCRREMRVEVTTWVELLGNHSTRRAKMESASPDNRISASLEAGVPLLKAAYRTSNTFQLVGEVRKNNLAAPTYTILTLQAPL